MTTHNSETLVFSNKTIIGSTNTITVIAIGSKGRAAVEHLRKTGIEDLSLIVYDKDSEAIPNGAQNQITKGSTTQIRQRLESGDTKLLFIVSSSDRGTEFVVNEIATSAKERGILTIVIATPSCQGDDNSLIHKMEEYTNSISKCIDSLIILDHQTIKNIYGDQPHDIIRSKTDERVAMTIKSIVDIIIHDGDLVNVDILDIEHIMRNSEVSSVGHTEIESQDQVQDIVETAISPLIATNIDTAKLGGVVLDVVYGKDDLKVDDLTLILSHIEKITSDKVNIIWGARCDKSFTGYISATIIISALKLQPNTKE